MKKIKKKFRAIVKVFADGSIKIEPVDPSGDWAEFNRDIKTDQQNRVPRAEAFLRELLLDMPGTVCPRNLIMLAADKQVYRGPLREAAVRLNLAHVVDVIDVT